MINIDDYKAYLKQNESLIEFLKDNQSIVIDRLEDVFKVLSFVEKKVDASLEIEEELQVIFEVGFSYLHEQLEEIKVYYHQYFKNDFLNFKKYESLINYVLYINDLEETLKERSLYTEKIDQVLKLITSEIDCILSSQSDFSDSIYDKFNVLLEENILDKVLTTNEIYGMIVEELLL